MKKLSSVLSLLLCLALICSAFAACKEEEEPKKTKDGLPAIWEDATYKKDTTLGEGAKTVTVTVEADGHSIDFTLKTDAATLGEALKAEGLIKGEDSSTGIYIKTVNGMLADYDVDQTYWGFFQGGEYMMSGVDSTKINGGEKFELVRTK